MDRSIALILTPSEAPFGDPRCLRSSPPPLTLGVLQAYLRSRGCAVRSTDLNTRLAGVLDPSDPQRWLPLYDEERVLHHLLDGGPTGLEDVLDQLLGQCRVEGSDVVGISTGTSMSFFEIHLALLLGRRIQNETGLPVVFGGCNLDYLWQFRAAFRRLWDAMLSAFQYLFVGPGERSFADLVSGSDRHPDAAFYQGLPGAVYSRNGELVRNPDGAPTLIRPDFAGLDLSHYTLCTQERQPIADSIETNLVHYYQWPVTRALAVSDDNRRKLRESDRRETLFVPHIFHHQCPYRCAFCVQSGSNGHSPVGRDPESVVDDLEALMAEHGTRYLRFFNNAINSSVPFLRTFCDLVTTRGLECYWSDCARFDTLTEDLVDRLYRAGCRKLVFGLDSASERILNLIDKRLNVDQARRVLRWCHDRGIWAEVEVIVGLPHEHEEDFQATYAFVADHLERGHLTGFHLNRYFVVPTSLLGQRPEHYGIRIHQSPDGYAATLRQGSAVLSTLVNPHRAPQRIHAYQYRLWTYSEVAGRTAEQIARETEDKYQRMAALAAPARIPRDHSVLSNAAARV
ncbi:MAG: radical SAM protein [Micromonosporaceae bacterium]|nr:radical SAM protein [Micromonosporaceae bacterium]